MALFETGPGVPSSMTSSPPLPPSSQSGDGLRALTENYLFVLTEAAALMKLAVGEGELRLLAARLAKSRSETPQEKRQV